jgi:5-methylcytosine-specific restriction protein B
MINCERIDQALIDYDPDDQKARVAKAEDQRVQLLARFPKDGWPEMTLDRYALGQPDHPDNFCRWMEFVTAHMGSIKGGSARKHLIYYQAEAGRWWFNEKLYPNVEEAWNAVHTGFLKAIEYAEAGEWDEIERIDALRSAPALRNKTLWAYFPDALMPINSQSHLRHYLRELGDPQADDQSLSTIKLSRSLLEGLRACGPVRGWTTQQLAFLLYSAFLPIRDNTELAKGTRVRLTRDVERFPAVVRAGRIGTVVLRDRGVLAVRLEEKIEGLADWQNELMWESEDEARADLEPLPESEEGLPSEQVPSVTEDPNFDRFVDMEITKVERDDS